MWAPIIEMRSPPVPIFAHHPVVDLDFVAIRDLSKSQSEVEVEVDDRRIITFCVMVTKAMFNMSIPDIQGIILIAVIVAVNGVPNKPNTEKLRD
jgi:hypothetical protein